MSAEDTQGLRTQGRLTLVTVMLLQKSQLLTRFPWRKFISTFANLFLPVYYADAMYHYLSSVWSLVCGSR